jgi:hypothetical protein
MRHAFVRRPLLRQPSAELDLRHGRAAELLGKRHHVTHVVDVAVGHDREIAACRLAFPVRA